MLKKIRSVWRAAVHRSAFEDGMDAEMRFHLDARTADLRIQLALALGALASVGVFASNRSIAAGATVNPEPQP